MSRGWIPYKVYTTAYDTVVDGVSLPATAPDEESSLRRDVGGDRVAAGLDPSDRPVAVLVE